MIKTIKKCFGNFIFSARLIISASKTYFVLNIFFSIITALVPYIPMLIWKELLNNLLDISVQNIIVSIVLLTAGYSLALIMQKTIGLFNKFVNYKYTDAVGYYLDNYIVSKVSSVELAFYDSSTLNNNLKNVTSHLRGSTETMVNTVFDQWRDRTCRSNRYDMYAECVDDTRCVDLDNSVNSSIEIQQQGKLSVSKGSFLYGKKDRVLQRPILR